MNTAIGAESEAAVHRVLQRARGAGHLRLKSMLAIMANRNRPPGLRLHADANAKRTLRLVLEFKAFQVGPKCIGNLAHSDGLCVFDLLLRPEIGQRASVPPIRTVARKIGT